MQGPKEVVVSAASLKDTWLSFVDRVYRHEWSDTGRPCRAASTGGTRPLSATSRAWRFQVVLLLQLAQVPSLRLCAIPGGRHDSYSGIHCTTLMLLGTVFACIQQSVKWRHLKQCILVERDGWMLGLQSAVHNARDDGSGRCSWWRRRRVWHCFLAMFFLGINWHLRFTCRRQALFILFPATVHTLKGDWLRLWGTGPINIWPSYLSAQP